MSHFDVFNGDADGMCSLHQLRLYHPVDAIIVTGVKRDIALLERTDAAAGDSVTVLDISLQVNRSALLTLLARGASVQYFDHHDCGEVPAHPLLETVIDTSPDVCTGILVDRWLGGKHRIWAAVAAFGDNLGPQARELAASLSLSLSPKQIQALQELGECLNYNAYGDSEADLIAAPSMLYDILSAHADPFGFIEDEPVFRAIRSARDSDLALARQVPAAHQAPFGKIMILPDAAWGRRVRGAYANLLAVESPAQAHAVLTPNGHGRYTISVRAPLAAMHGADLLCNSFPSGGGRPAAAGINELGTDMLPQFIAAFERAFCGK